MTMEIWQRVWLWFGLALVCSLVGTAVAWGLFFVADKFAIPCANIYAPVFTILVGYKAGLFDI